MFAFNLQKQLLFLFLIVLSLFSFDATASIKVVLRYDDYRLKSDSLDNALYDMFQRQNVPVTLAVIPYDEHGNFVCDTTLNKYSILKQDLKTGKVEIALHGYSHVEKNGNGEFKEVSYDEQYRRIRQGKSLLDSILNGNVVTFIPPWNLYDGNTVKSLVNNGFKIISADIYNAYHNTTIQYFPYAIDSPNLLLPTIKMNKGRNGIIVLMFHAYDFNNGFTINDFEKIIEEVKQNKDVQFVRFIDLLNVEASDAARIHANKRSNLLSKKMNLGGMLYTTKYYQTIRIVNSLLYVSGFLLITMLGYLLLFRKGKKKTHILLCAACSLTVFLLVYFHCLSPMKLVLTTILLSVFFLFVLKIIGNKSKVELK